MKLIAQTSDGQYICHLTKEEVSLLEAGSRESRFKSLREGARQDLLSAQQAVMDATSNLKKLIDMVGP